MTKQEFLEKLNSLLNDIPKTERDEAIEYYQEYFEEAGINDLEDVSGRIDAPEKIAATIKADLGQGHQEEEAFTERGYYESGVHNSNELMRNGEISRESGQNQNNGQYYTKGSGIQNEKAPMEKWKVILIIVLALITSPIWGGLVIGLGGILLGIIATIFSVTVAVVAIAFALLVTGIICIVVGITKIAIAPAAGITTTGIGLLCFGIGILFVILTVWFFSFLLPTCGRGIKWAFQRLTGRRERA